MIVRSTSVYSSSVGLLREAREREARGRIGSGIYTMPLAIRVHRRVEMSYFSKDFDDDYKFPSVYIGELKFPGRFWL